MRPCSNCKRTAKETGFSDFSESFDLCMECLEKAFENGEFD